MQCRDLITDARGHEPLAGLELLDEEGDMHVTVWVFVLLTLHALDLGGQRRRQLVDIGPDAVTTNNTRQHR